MMIPSIIIVLCLVAICVYVATRKPTQPIVDRLQEQINALTVQTITPGDVFVLSRAPLSDVMKGSIDSEFANMRAIAERLGYTNKLAYSAYTVLVFPSERDYNLDGVYSPSFKVYLKEGDAYIGSQYDQGGWIYAAEQVLDLEQCRFVIAESDNPAYIRESVHNGLDHILLYHNDRERYEATKSHANGGSHPILT